MERRFLRSPETFELKSGLLFHQPFWSIWNWVL
jgi:hypothetical protein